MANKKDSVQDYWNEFESKFVTIVDEIAPFQPSQQIELKKSKPPPHTKNKINKRNQLLKKLRTNSSKPEVRSALKSLNKEIKMFSYICLVTKNRFGTQLK